MIIVSIKCVYNSINLFYLKLNLKWVKYVLNNLNL